MKKLVDSITNETVMTLTEKQEAVLLKIRDANRRMIAYQDRADMYLQSEFDRNMHDSYERWSEEMYTLCKGMLTAFNIMSESSLTMPSALFDKIQEA